MPPQKSPQILRTTPLHQRLYTFYGRWLLAFKSATTTTTTTRRTIDRHHRPTQCAASRVAPSPTISLFTPTGATAAAAAVVSCRVGRRRPPKQHQKNTHTTIASAHRVAGLFRKCIHFIAQCSLVCCERPPMTPQCAARQKRQNTASAPLSPLYCRETRTHACMHVRTHARARACFAIPLQIFTDERQRRVYRRDAVVGERKRAWPFRCARARACVQS